MGGAIRRDFGAQRAWFVSMSVRSAFGSSQFQRAAPAVVRTFRLALARSGFASGEHASVVSAPARMPWVSFTRRVIARK